MILKGRFPQVSGLFFTYEPSRPPWDRVDEKLVKIQNQHLISDKVFTEPIITFYILNKSLRT